MSEAAASVLPTSFDPAKLLVANFDVAGYTEFDAADDDPERVENEAASHRSYVMSQRAH